MALSARKVNVTVCLDRDVKENAELLFKELGLSLSAAVGVFARQAIQQGKIPFEICDPFYGKSNMDELKRIAADIEAGKGLSPHNLIEDGAEDE
ncbi:MAG: type II toxin-antitoxin system RelB/DinJ family antitoxin [Clostridiales bacterium]|jgi:DNA-damage-inducible protein J|nr:type II toxin-antitoxin system RelB/DinJ family antitoxin [Clostridiales bacterium]